LGFLTVNTKSTVASPKETSRRFAVLNTNEGFSAPWSQASKVAQPPRPRIRGTKANVPKTREGGRDMSSFCLAFAEALPQGLQTRPFSPVGFSLGESLGLSECGKTAPYANDRACTGAGHPGQRCRGTEAGDLFGRGQRPLLGWA